MKFEFIGNACGIFTSNAGTRILCDPWLVDGVFEGSWFHNPPITTTYSDVYQQIDGMYLSHIHPDHYDDRGMFDKSLPIIVLDHEQNYLIKKLERDGFFNLIKVKDRETIEFEGFGITLYAPFTKDPFHEAKVGNVIDSAMLIEADGDTALNANDNTLTVEAAKQFEGVDLALLNYNPAGPYPACFSNLSVKEKDNEANRLLNRNLVHLDIVLSQLQPKFFVPFAGSYQLGGKLYDKNRWLGVSPELCLDMLSTVPLQHKEKRIVLHENDVLDIKTGEVTPKIAAVKYPYEMDEMPHPGKLQADLISAGLLMQKRCKEVGLNIQTCLIIDITPHAMLMAGNTSGKVRLECKLDPRLLRRILDRKAQWNNAEIGCHIEFHREPNEYEYDAHMALQFLHL